MTRRRDTAAHPRKRRRRAALAALAALCLTPLAARAWMHSAASGAIHSRPEKLRHCRVALVLGAGLRPDGTPSPILADRIRAAVKLHKAGVVQKLLMSGDNRFQNYNEPRRMKEMAVRLGVPEADIAMDFAGRRTYDSAFRARSVFGQRQIIVVTQRFHLDRAIFLCRAAGMEAEGFPADATPVPLKPRIREFLASAAALADVYILRPEPVPGPQETL